MSLLRYHSAVLKSGWESLHSLVRYRAIMMSDPMWMPADETDRLLLYRHRKRCRALPEALPKYLLAIDWTEQKQREETLRLVQQWASLPWQVGLQLLDARNMHALVRSRATHSLEQIGDDQLLNFMGQLVQALKYEPYHSNALCTYLMSRAFRCPSIIGHRLYWYLRAEIHVPQIKERFGLMLDEYVKSLPPLLRGRLSDETGVIEKLMKIGAEMKRKDIRKEDRNSILRAMLRELKLPDKFRCPLVPRFESCGLNVDKCFVLDSAQRPIWLVFQNHDSEELAKNNMVPAGHREYNVILKKGDDLRQDILTLQMMRIMDDIWKSEGMDLAMIPYGCISTGDAEGFVEVVTGATTCADIIREGSGVSEAYGAVFNDQHYETWLGKYNAPGEEWEAAQDLFMRSNAGYCVATYILGIGDRHPSNIMMRKNGQFFRAFSNQTLASKHTHTAESHLSNPFVLCVICRH